MQDAIKALGRICLGLLSKATPDALLQDLEMVRILENILPAILLEENCDELLTATQLAQRRKWFEVLLREIAAKASGASAAAYALVPALRRVWAENADAGELQTVVDLVVDRLLLVHSQVQAAASSASAAEAGSDEDCDDSVNRADGAVDPAAEQERLTAAYATQVRTVAVFFSNEATF